MTATTILREQLRAEYDELLNNPFPKLGYRIDGLPEASAVLAGYVTQAFNPSHRIVLDPTPVVNSELANKAVGLCQTRQATPEAAELEAYMEKVARMEGTLRRLVALQAKE